MPFGPSAASLSRYVVALYGEASHRAHTYPPFGAATGARWDHLWCAQNWPIGRCAQPVTNEHSCRIECVIVGMDIR